MLGHSGYLPVCRRAFLYALRNNKVEFTDAQVDEFMEVWQQLSPFDDAVQGLKRLGEKYTLIAMSNGEPWFLEHLVKNRIKVDFDRIISVEEAGFFKPHPAVYRTACRILETEPGEIMMVAAHGFDIVGARACGFRGAYVDRYKVPFDEAPYKADIWVDNFVELADKIVG